MAVHSTLRSDLQKTFAHFSKGYAKHRPVVQRILNILFALYVIGSTYRGIAARPGKPPSSSSSHTGGGGESTKGKGRGKSKGGSTNDPNKPQRVAVSILC